MNPKLKVVIFWAALSVAGVIPWLAVTLIPKSNTAHTPMGLVGCVATAVCISVAYLVLVAITRPNPKEKVTIGFLLIGAFIVWMIVLSRPG